MSEPKIIKQIQFNMPIKDENGNPGIKTEKYIYHSDAENISYENTNIKDALDNINQEIKEINTKIEENVENATNNINTSINNIINGTIAVGKANTANNSTNANTATKLSTNAGSETQPVYFNNGIPVATKHTLNTTVPANAKFTDTVYTLPSAGTALGGVKSGGVATISNGQITKISEATKATQDGSGQNIANTYATKTSVTNLTTEVNKAAKYEIGDMLTTVRKDLGNDWLNCDGSIISYPTYNKTLKGLLKSISTYPSSDFVDTDYSNKLKGGLFFKFDDTRYMLIYSDGSYYLGNDPCNAHRISPTPAKTTLQGNLLQYNLINGQHYIFTTTTCYRINSNQTWTEINILNKIQNVNSNYPISTIYSIQQIIKGEDNYFYLLCHAYSKSQHSFIFAFENPESTFYFKYANEINNINYTQGYISKPISYDNKTYLIFGRRNNSNELSSLLVCDNLQNSFSSKGRINLNVIESTRGISLVLDSNQNAYAFFYCSVSVDYALYICNLGNLNNLSYDGNIIKTLSTKSDVNITSRVPILGTFNFTNKTLTGKCSIWKFTDFADPTTYSHYSGYQSTSPGDCTEKEIKGVAKDIDNNQYALINSQFYSSTMMKLPTTPFESPAKTYLKAK